MIPFIYVYANPSGAGLGQCVQTIDRPAEIQALADNFIIRGGRYVITKFVDDVVQIQAVVLGLDERPHPIATQTAPDGPLLPGAIDRLVRESIRQLDMMQ